MTRAQCDDDDLYCMRFYSRVVVIPRSTHGARVQPETHFLCTILPSQCCPYPLMAIPGFLVFLAMIFTWVSAFNCNFYRITDTFEGNSTHYDLHVGLWTVEGIDPYGDDSGSGNDGNDYEDLYCAFWSEPYLFVPAASMVELDGAMVAARFFSLLASLLSLIGFVLIIVPCCMTFDDPRKYMRIMSGLFVAIGALVLLDLVALASDICGNAETCSLQGGGNLAIAASVTWFLSAALMFVAFNVKSFCYTVETTVLQPAAATLRETRTVNNPDGSKTTITKMTVTNPDGSTTVTETTETMAPPLAESATPAAALPAAVPMASVLSVEGEPVRTSAKAVP